MVFEGEEWAASSPFQYFADHDDPEMARSVSEGRKKEFSAFGRDPASIPDPECKETFERSRLKWEEVSQFEHREMLAWYRELIRLRRSTACLNDGEPGNTKVFYDQQEKWFRMERGSISVICNLGEAEHTFRVPEGSRVLLASSEAVSLMNELVTLMPDTVAVLNMNRIPK
jgi:maltooligosyltrehalose trehalohydrolase